VTAILCKEQGDQTYARFFPLFYFAQMIHNNNIINTCQEKFVALGTEMGEMNRVYGLYV